MRTFLQIGLATVFAFAGACSNAQPVISVVRTWGDLEGVPTLSVVPFPRPRNGEPPPTVPPVACQVGISGDRVAVGGSLVLYFLAPSAPEERDTPGERGLYTILAEGTEDAYVDQGSAEFSRLDPVPAGTTFYAVSIPFAKAGDYVVKLIKPFYDYSAKPPPLQVYAQVAVHVQNPPDEMWYPLWETEKENGGGAPQGKDNDGQVYAIVPVSNPKGGAAVPATRRPGTYAQLPPAGQILPSLYAPASVPPGVTIRMNDATLSVNFPEPIEGFYPEDAFLTRWWINGKPATLDPTLERPQQMRALAAEVRFSKLYPMGLYGARTWYTQRVHFELHFQPDWLGVKKGDKVGLQLLFCPGGFIPVRAGSSSSFIFGEEPKSDQPVVAFSEISNQIEFIYSGYPAHPQQ